MSMSFWVGTIPRWSRGAGWYGTRTSQIRTGGTVWNRTVPRNPGLSQPVHGSAVRSPSTSRWSSWRWSRGPSASHSRGSSKLRLLSRLERVLSTVLEALTVIVLSDGRICGPPGWVPSGRVAVSAPLTPVTLEAPPSRPR